MQLKPLHEQVIVITGASSGIGLTTARMAAEHGARLVLAARNEDALRQLAQEIEANGGQAAYVAADVGEMAEVRRIADAALDRFGGFDTWVNNAGVSILGRITETPLDEQRRLFDTNYWGVVHGSFVAVEHLRERGGVVINIGSIVSDRAIPLQGVYSASKHAVKGFTEALRMELELEKLPIAVSLIKPSAIDTPYVDHARNYMDRAVKLPPPVYAPETVARAVLACAERPRRDVVVGGGGRLLIALGHQAARLTDKVMEATMVRAQQRPDRPPAPRDQHTLFRPGADLRQRGGHPGHVSRTSAYTQARLHPVMTGLAVAGAGLLAARLLR